MLKESHERCAAYLAQAKAQGRSVPVWLVNQMPDPQALHEALTEWGDWLGTPFLADATLQALPTQYERLSWAECARLQVLCVCDEDQWVWVVADPTDYALCNRLAVLGAQHGEKANKVASSTRMAFALEESIQARLRRDEADIRAVDTLAASGDEAGEVVRHDLTLASIAADASPVVKRVHATLYDAWRVGASDVHYETTAQGLQVKCRLDGVLSVLQQVPGAAQAEQMISRLKVMAELDIAERRIPQDGRFKLHMDGRPVDFRVSVMPSALGEDVVVRVLDKKSVTQNGVISLESLGFVPEDRRQIHQLAWEPHGMLLVTGPTGSGKTTTLYAVVNELHSTEEKIITIEDPVEYNLPGVLQIPVNDKKGLTFARGLRSILRHDPDKILVGEIRDSETAQIAIQSALTGHLVLTTVHANNTLDVIGRFAHMGVDVYNFVSALNGVVAQRLIRRNCSHCVRADSDSADWLAQLPEREELSPHVLLKGQGCRHCRGTGFSGRTVIAEILMLDDSLRELIVQRAPVRELKQYAQTQGFVSLRSRALNLVREGLTSVGEFVRVVGVRGQ